MNNRTGGKRFRQKQGNREFETDKVRGENRCSSAGKENSLGESQFVQDWPYFFPVNIPKVKNVRPAYILHCTVGQQQPILMPSFSIPLPRDLFIYLLIYTLLSISIPAMLNEGWHSLIEMHLTIEMLIQGFVCKSAIWPGGRNMQHCHIMYS